MSLASGGPRLFADRNRLFGESRLARASKHRTLTRRCFRVDYERVFAYSPDRFGVPRRGIVRTDAVDRIEHFPGGDHGHRRKPKEARNGSSGAAQRVVPAGSTRDSHLWVDLDERAGLAVACSRIFLDAVHIDFHSGPACCYPENPRILRRRPDDRLVCLRRVPLDHLAAIDL
jgi:hypothetical protein